MAKLQKYFEVFHNRIRADYDMSATLREKKDIIIHRIRKHLKESGRPGFDELLQGSYKMKTGVVPTAGLDYDIDVGLRFPFTVTEHTATDVRRWVLEAVGGHTEDVCEMRPCIRVTYADGYHVDLVSYARWEDGAGKEQYRLAHKTNVWRPADPPALLEHVRTARGPFEGTEDSATLTDQFRRCVRYLRRWNDVQNPKESDDKPAGLAFVLLAIEHLQPRYFVAGEPDDRTALADLARAAAYTAGRIVAKKPTPEYEDMFGLLSDDAMNRLKSQFRVLATTLDAAGREADPVEACKGLQEVFGPDFPVPTPEDTARKTDAPAVVTSSSSA